MCGIVAILTKDKSVQSKNISLLSDSFNILESRGPDSGQIIKRDNGIFGFQRLSINDKSVKGSQPIEDNNGVVLMCNGEIYNHKELQKEFNITCVSDSDCEVIIGLYNKIGFKKTVEMLDGVFAIVISDGDNVYMARDRIGVRPLYEGVIQNSNELAVASVAKCLTHFCDNVRQIEPGILIYNNITKQKIFTKYTFDIREIKDPVYDKIRDTLINSVKKRLMSDRPIGCLLSGGLDSSLVTSILCKLLGPKNVRTYSIGMENSTDLKYAKKVADYLGTSHTEVLFTPEEGLEIIPEVIYALESYDITTIRASVGMYLISKYISENTSDKVIFSGEGSDELLAGYLYFHFAPSTEELYKEGRRLVDDLYLYDVLRADRTVSVHGLELRVPFLDKDFVDLSLSLTGVQKMPKHKYEKYILRYAFKDHYLPEEVLWRRKEGFSDGVSSVKTPWFKLIQDHASKFVSDEEFNKSSFLNKEAMWYKKIYNSYFPTYQPEMYMWMPKWINSKDPSGRVTGAYDEKE